MSNQIKSMSINVKPINKVIKSAQSYYVVYFYAKSKSHFYILILLLCKIYLDFIKWVVLKFNFLNANFKKAIEGHIQ